MCTLCVCVSNGVDDDEGGEGGFVDVVVCSFFVS